MSDLSVAKTILHDAEKAPNNRESSKQQQVINESTSITTQDP